MGRRKIEIKAIKDDRNRSVTFLKRKGGLFKKAHELSVLCSVDVAVIIFGNNKKLYEYSSSDIGDILTRYQYCGGANEHKGPADFSGKGKIDDEYDDDDDVSGPSNHGSVEPQMMPPQFQNQAAYQHIRHQTPSASPPIPYSHHQPQRQHTPQPQIPEVRPASRNASNRTGSNLVSQHAQRPQHAQHAQHQHPQPSNGYNTYMSNIAMYNSHNTSIPPHQHTILPHIQGPPMQTLTIQNSQYTPPQSSHQQIHLHQQQQQQQQLHHAYQEEQRKSTMPPSFPKERPSSRPGSPPPQSQHLPEPPSQDVSVKQESQPVQQPTVPVKRIPVKSRSIFTPIDDSRSILHQHWASSTAKADPSRSETSCSINRSQSLIDGANQSEKYPTPPVCAQSHPQNRASDVPTPEGYPSQSRSYSSSHSGGKRPVLKVQIPDEPSDEGSVTAVSSSSPSATNASSYSRRNGNTTDSMSSGVVLPPPSPLAGSLLSAGATGPPNPFARPHSVPQNTQGATNSSNSTNGNVINGNTSNENICNTNTVANSNPNTNDHNNSNTNNNVIETPVSALPSRFMGNDLLPSPSGGFLEYYRGTDGNPLPSPLNFATPVIGMGPSFAREETGRKDMAGNPYGKRKSPEENEAGQIKRSKNE